MEGIVQYIFIFLYLISLFISLDSSLKKVPAGRLLVEKVASGTTTFFEWRASDNVKEELAGIKNFFGWTAFSLLLSFFILAKQVSQTTLSLICGAVIASVVIWYSFSSFLDIKKQIKSWATPVGLIVVMPWVYALMKSFGYGDLGFFVFFEPLLSFSGIESVSIYMQAFIISFILFIGASVYFGGSMLVLLAIPGSIYTILKLSVFISQKWGLYLPKWLYTFFVIYYVVVTMYFFVNAAL